MSDLSSLKELAKFVGRSAAGAPPASHNGLALKIDQHGRPTRPKVTEMLGVVLALSARTRRMAREPVIIDLDVFTPDGHRAIKLACAE
ncbi:MAG: hypothetical protein GXP01_00845 [Alphaproteobacteria bacterium]|nr:hypothetical protein [Alphaproteobacteria bacterium]